MRILRLFILLVSAVTLISFAGCSKESAKPKLPVYKVGLEPIEIVPLPEDSHVLPYWLQSGVSHRTLVRFSSVDGLIPVGDDVIKTIRELAKKEDFNGITALTTPAAQVAYTSENMVYVANRLGIVDEVVWVVPHLNSLSQADLDDFINYVSKDNPTHKVAYSALKLKDNIAEGMIFGIPVRIVSLQDLPKIEKPVLFDLDISYFHALYVNEKETGILTLASGLVNNLKEKGISTDMLTVSPSSSGVAPTFRFLAYYMKDLFHDPSMTDKTPPKLWKERAEAWKVSQKSVREGIPVFKSILKSFPDDAASHYDLAALYFETGDAVACKAELDKAYAIDNGYLYGYAYFSARAAKNGLQIKPELFARVPGQ